MFPKNTVNGGQYATNKITIAPVMKKGTKSFTHSSIEIPAILQDIKSVVPTGGVNNPIAREQSTTMDMWIGSIPIPMAIGIKIGRKMYRLGTLSITIPAKKRIKIITKSISTGSKGSRRNKRNSSCFSRSDRNTSTGKSKRYSC